MSSSVTARGVDDKLSVTDDVTSDAIARFGAFLWDEFFLFLTVISCVCDVIAKSPLADDVSVG